MKLVRPHGRFWPNAGSTFDRFSNNPMSAFAPKADIHNRKQTISYFELLSVTFRQSHVEIADQERPAVGVIRNDLVRRRPGTVP